MFICQAAAIATTAIAQSNKSIQELARSGAHSYSNMSGHRPSRYSNPVGIAGSSFKDFSKLARAIREQTTAPGLFSLISCGKSIGGKGFLLEAKDPQAAASIVKAWEKLKVAQGGDGKAAGVGEPPQWGWLNNGGTTRGH